MKRILMVILTVILCLAACVGCNKAEEVPTTGNSSSYSYRFYKPEEPTDWEEVQEAVERFKINPNTSVAGYTLADNGMLSGPDGFYENIHVMYSLVEDSKILMSERTYAYISIGSMVYKFSFGEMLGAINIGDAVYCGISEECGLIFKKISDVVAVDWDLTSAKRIATGVELVIECDYAYSSDAWSQPVFLMENGDIKVYVSWYEDLVDPIYEGGFGGTRL